MHLAGTSLIISHDRWFLDRLATHILAFEDDGSQVCPFTRSPNLKDCCAKALSSRSSLAQACVMLNTLLPPEDSTASVQHPHARRICAGVV